MRSLVKPAFSSATLAIDPRTNFPVAPDGIEGRSRNASSVPDSIRPTRNRAFPASLSSLAKMTQAPDRPSRSRALARLMQNTGIYAAGAKA